jgi:hypothetical protein
MLPIDAKNGPIALARAPKDLNTPIITPFSSTSPSKKPIKTNNKQSQWYIWHQKCSTVVRDDHCHT